MIPYYIDSLCRAIERGSGLQKGKWQNIVAHLQVEMLAGITQRVAWVR
jgi:hypothetical protein